MTHIRKWMAEIFIDEHEDRTRAEARLRGGGDIRLVGVGDAHLNPTDKGVPEIGDELATARALADLAHKLLETTAQDIEAFTHHPVRLAK